MATYRILHKISDPERITTCNNDLEFIRFVNRVQTENGDDHTYDVEECKNYILKYSDNLQLVDEDYVIGEEDFEFYMDQKHTVWLRTWFSVQARSQEEANEKVRQMYDNDEIEGDTEYLYETLEEMSLEDNDDMSTVEIYTEHVDLVLQNGE
jgi:hypothetical protein